MRKGAQELTPEEFSKQERELAVRRNTEPFNTPLNVIWVQAHTLERLAAYLKDRSGCNQNIAVNSALDDMLTDAGY